ncbi:MAG: hypothetical protein EKK63_09030 [Acinetobacter sp.]|uniref:hypothetical protein n=1 Tax=Acinetobacter sp. TaxID=472 RepID=UPI000FBF4783|nr:hypothetical protein [Acinetobacter sp.]RUP39771.1 MAG: hypothetical protein EKK63_09030 [Acinetobacter sp.]
MTTSKTFNAEMIKGNKITWTKKAEITVNGTTVTLQQYKNEAVSVWVSTPTTYNRVAKDMEVNEAIIFANSILSTI